MKYKLLLIFQPAFWMIVISLLAGLSGFWEGRNIFIPIIFFPITLSYIWNYVTALRNKTIMIRSVMNYLVMLFLAVMTISGQAFSGTDMHVSILISIAFTMAFIFSDVFYIKDLFKENLFVENMGIKPELSVYVDNEFEGIFKPNIKHLLKFKADRFSFLLNDIWFDRNGVKESTVNYERIKKYLEDSLVSPDSFSREDLKVITMMDY